MHWGIPMAAALAAATGACASYSEKIAATYVSPVIYENLSCREIAEEASRAGLVASIYLLISAVQFAANRL